MNFLWKGLLEMFRKNPCLKLSGCVREYDDLIEASVQEDDCDMLEEPAGTDFEKFFCNPTNAWLGKKIEQEGANFLSDKRRLLAFCMCRHRRLGSESPARILFKDCLRVIWRVMQSMDSILVVEGRKAGSAVFSLSMADFSWSRLPDIPVSLNSPRGCSCLCLLWFVAEKKEKIVLGLGSGKIVVLGGVLDRHGFDLPNRDVWLFEDGSWSRIEANVSDKLGRGGAVEWNGRLLLLGGQGKGVGRRDVLLDLHTLSPIDFPSRPDHRKFWNVIKSARFGSLLVCKASCLILFLKRMCPKVVLAVAKSCINLMKDVWNGFFPSKNPLNCCVQFVAIDLNNIQDGWFDLPWLSKVHIRDCNWRVEVSLRAFCFRVLVQRLKKGILFDH